MRTTLVFCSLVLSAGASADAGGELAALEPVPVTAIRSSFWRAVVRPDEARAEQLVQQARARLYPGLGLGLLFATDLAAQRRLSIESALVRLSRAVALAPTQREARLLYAKALSLWEDRSQDGSSSSKTGEAIEQLEALRALDPAYEAQEVAFELGVLHTRNADFARAAAEYARALRERSDDDRDTTLLGNLAEVTMLCGDLSSALSLYERAASLGEGSDRLLALWGSAVVLDRLGESQRALTEARRALDEDRLPLAVLHQSGVFFVPAHELFYYEGLGNLALADREREPGESLSTLLQGGLRWLARPDNGGALSQFERAVAELGDETKKPLKTALDRLIARGRTSLRAHPPRAADARTVADLPSARDARTLLWQLRALAAFERYLRHDGGSGPFAQDARDHLQQIEHTLPTCSRPETLCF